MEEIFKGLADKFQMYDYSQTSGYKLWVLISWTYYGADYGVDLIYRDATWTMRQMLESGYVKGKVLIETKDYNEILPYIEVFAPTNKDYKTDRK